MPSIGSDAYAFDMRPGMSRQDMLTIVPYHNFGQASAEDVAITGEAGPQDRPVNYLWYLLGIFLLLVLLKYAMEHRLSKMQPTAAGIGVWNFVAVGTMSLLYIIVIKTILNKYHVRGLTDLVNVA